jgi:hypothetical protein
LLKLEPYVTADPRRPTILDVIAASGYFVAAVVFYIQVLAMTRIARLHNQWSEEMKNGAMLEERLVCWWKLRTLF